VLSSCLSLCTSKRYLFFRRASWLKLTHSLVFGRCPVGNHSCILTILSGGFHGFPQLLHTNSGNKLGCDCLLPRPFQSIIHSYLITGLRRMANSSSPWSAVWHPSGWLLLNVYCRDIPSWYTDRQVYLTYSILSWWSSHFICIVILRAYWLIYCSSFCLFLTFSVVVIFTIF
jgi:hypothetical protein